MWLPLVATVTLSSTVVPFVSPSAHRASELLGELSTVADVNRREFWLPCTVPNRPVGRPVPLSGRGGLVAESRLVLLVLLLLLLLLRLLLRLLLPLLFTPMQHIPQPARSDSLHQCLARRDPSVRTLPVIVPLVPSLHHSMVCLAIGVSFGNQEFGMRPRLHNG